MSRTLRLHRALVGCLLAGVLALAACGSSSGTSTGSGGNGTPTVAPTATATPKPKPSSVPAVTKELCNHLMSLDEVNQIIKPANPATKISAGTGDGFGTCHYTYGPGDLLHEDLLITLETYKGHVPITQQDITDFLASTSDSPNVTITTFQQVSGVGDQAAFLAATFHESTLTAYADGFAVLYGKVLFDCATVTFGTSPPSASDQKPKLQQCAEQVLSRL